MKKFLTIITLLGMFLLVGCVDLDEVWNELESLKKQNAEQAKELEKENAKFAAFEEWYKKVEKNDEQCQLGDHLHQGADRCPDQSVERGILQGAGRHEWLRAYHERRQQDHPEAWYRRY
ncbi:MAG: hypothetical protein ACOX19_02955 [Fermentimonas sp.]